MPNHSESSGTLRGKLTVTIRGAARGPRAQFIRAVSEDLFRAGIHAQVKVRCGRLVLRVVLPTQTRSRLLSIAKRIQRNQLRTYRTFMTDVRRRYAATLLRSGRVDPVTIRPRLHLCASREDFRIFTYCRLLQSVPTAHLVGRRMAWLVFDSAASPERLLGAFGLNGSAYSLGPRDGYLHWRGEGTTTLLKERGLGCVMDMPVCMALSPYSVHRAGKLVAGLALSREVSETYVRRYSAKLPDGGSLLAIITLCATGIHCPIYHRVRLRTGGAYRRIGMTKGFSAAFISDGTVALARRVLAARGRRLRDGVFAKSLRLVKRALELSGVPGEPLLRTGLPKGIYIGAAETCALDMLRVGQFASISRPSIDQIKDIWASRLTADTNMKGGTFEGEQ